MSGGIQFNDENDFKFKSKEVFGASKKPRMVKWLQEKGIVKNERVAQYLLIGVVVVCSLSSLIVFARVYNFSFSTQKMPTEEEVISDLKYDPGYLEMSESEKKDLIKSLTE
jgi:hypothetical protein